MTYTMFSGKRYTRVSKHERKSAANKYANVMRKQGYYARVVLVKHSLPAKWWVFARKWTKARLAQEMKKK